MEAQIMKEDERLRKAQAEHITAHLPKLIEWTVLSSLTIAVFEQKKILGSADKSKLKSIRDDHDRNMEFYEIIRTRSNFFQVLLEAMEGTGQSGVLDILRKFNGDGEQGQTCTLSPNPRKYLSLASDLQEFVDSRANQTVCIVSTIDPNITLEKISENLGGKCAVYCDLVDFLLPISSPRSGEQLHNPSCYHVLKVTNYGDLENIINDTNKMPNAGKMLVVCTPQENDMRLQDLYQRKPSWREIVTISHDNMEWGNLSPAFKQVIRTRLKENIQIDFQVDFNVLLRGEVLVQLINGKELNMFKATIPKPLDYYVERLILTRNVISNDIFGLKQDASQSHFLLTGITRSELFSRVTNEETETGNSRKQLQQDEVTATFMIQDDPTHFERIRKSLEKSHGGTGVQASVHLLERGTDKRLHWEKSVGGIGVLRTFIDKSQDALTEDELIQVLKSKLNAPVCICDSPGMGKSVLLGQIATKLVQQHPEREIIFLNIVHFIHQVKEPGATDDDPVLKAVQNLICKNDLAKTVLKFKFNSVDNMLIELLLDGFDELETANYKFALGIICKIVSTYKSVRLWVTSRRHFLNELEDYITTLGYTISPFGEEDQVKFLVAYWTSINSHLDEEKLKKFSNECIKEIKSDVSSSNKDIAGIPLQCRLIGEVYQKAAVQYSKTGSNVQCKSELFEVRSIQKLFERTIEDRLKKHEEINKGCKLTKEEIMVGHARVALEFLFPEHFRMLEFLFKPIQREDILKVGLLEASSNPEETPQFVHRTYAEYFTAWLLVFKLSSKTSCTNSSSSSSTSELHGSVAAARDILGEFLFTELLDSHQSRLDTEQSSTISKSHGFKFNVITYFLNSLLSKKQLEVIKTCFTNNFTIPRLTSKMTKQLIQACANDNHLQIFKFLLELNIGKTEDSSSIFGHDFLLLAIKKSGCEFVKLALKQFEEYNSFDDRELQLLVLRSAARRGDCDILMEIFLKQKQLHRLVKDGEVPGILHECVMFTKGISETEIGERKTICETLVSCNRSILEDLNESGRTPLLRSDAHVELLISLIKLDADLSAFDELGDTILHLNFDGGRQFSNQEFETLLETIPTGQLKKLVGKKGAGGDLPIVRLLKQIDLTPQILRMFKGANLDFSHGNNSLLATAVKSGRGKVTLQKLIEFGAGVDWVMDGKSPLHIAVEFGNVDAIEILLGQTDIDVNMEDADGFTALEYAVHRRQYLNRFETGKLLHDRGCKLNENVSDDEKSWLHVYAGEGDYEAVRLILHCGSRINCVDKFGNTPLHLGMMEWELEEEMRQHSYYDIAQLLLQHNIDPNQANSFGNTPFDISLRNKYLDLETYNLLKPKTNDRWPEALATSALLFAIRTANSLDEDEFYSLIEECIDHKANINCTDDAHNTPLHIAVDKMDERAVKLFVRNGANYDLLNTQLQAPLHRAALHKNVEAGLKLSKYLIDSGANTCLADTEGRTFLHYFCVENRSSASQLYSIASFLMERNHLQIFDSEFLSYVAAQSGYNDTLELVRKVRPDFASTPATSEQLKYYTVAPVRDLIGTKALSISRVISELRKANDFAEWREKWSTIARELDMPLSKIKTLRHDLLLNKITLTDVLFETLEEWVCRVGDGATKTKLAQVFKNAGMMLSADALERMQPAI